MSEPRSEPRSTDFKPPSGMPPRRALLPFSAPGKLLPVNKRTMDHGWAGGHHGTSIHPSLPIFSFLSPFLPIPDGKKRKNTDALDRMEGSQHRPPPRRREPSSPQGRSGGEREERKREKQRGPDRWAGTRDMGVPGTIVAAQDSFSVLYLVNKTNHFS